MGRLLRSAIRVQGELVGATPVHSGAFAEDAFSDLPLAVDGKGVVYFPGSGIAGPLRAWCRDADPSLVDSVWGRVESGPNSGWASILIVHDAPLICNIERDIAQHVGIDHEAGTAAVNLKFDRELAPVQARFRLSLELQRPEGHYGPKRKMDDPRWERVQSLLRGMLEDLASGVIRFGADKSRGRGRLRLEKVGVEHRDLGGGILDTLQNRASPKIVPLGDHVVQALDQLFPERIKGVRPKDRPVTLTLECIPVAPIMQRHEAEGAAVDMMPAVAIDGAERKPFLSGTGIKGAFRAQSARIMRTVLNRDRPDEALDLVIALYGDKADKAAKTDKETLPLCDDPRYRQPGRGAVSFDDCRFDRALTLEHWRKLLTLEPEDGERLATFRKEAQRTGWKNFTPAAMVAIDRWTGGAADRFLFNRLEPDMDRIAISATVHLERIAPPHCFWKRIDTQRGSEQRDLTAEREALVSFRRSALALFLLTLRDFARGRIPLGYGVNRGLGDLDLEKATFSDLPDWVCCSKAGTFEVGPDDFRCTQSMERFQPLQNAWDNYLECNRGPD